jgi:hypothetical protein
MAMLENILELAYIQDPKVFDRDSATRRSKQRADLRAETGEYDLLILRLRRRCLRCITSRLYGHTPWIPIPDLASDFRCTQQAGTTSKSKDGGLC